MTRKLLLFTTLVGLAALFVEHIEGSHSGIMGLPLFETATALAGIGFPVL